MAIVVNGKKYACNSCIKGHRSGKCNHKNRELLELQPKGRPKTQCAHCRELRIVKKIHIKCLCTDAPCSSSIYCLIFSYDY